MCTFQHKSCFQEMSIIKLLFINSFRNVSTEVLAIIKAYCEDFRMYYSIDGFQSKRSQIIQIGFIIISNASSVL